MKIFLFLLSLFLAAAMLPQIALAVNDTLSAKNCDSLGFVPSLCGTLREYSRRADWSVDQEKRYLLNIFAEGGIMPKHDFVGQWNTKLEFGNEAPDNEPTKEDPCNYLSSHNCISEAWIRTFAVMPSFIENETFYIKENGVILAGYHYNLSAPPLDVAGGSPDCDEDRPSDNRYGDCRTEFWYEDHSAFDVKMDGVSLFDEMPEAEELGGKALVQFTTANENPIFSSELLIENRVFMKHFEWDRGEICGEHCYSVGSGEDRHEVCEPKYNWYCEPTGSVDSTTEYLDIPHDFEGDVELFEYNAESHRIIIENVKTTPKGVITTNARDYKLFMNKALLHKAGSRYPLVYSYPPYNILAVARNISYTYFEKDIHVDKTGNTTASFTTYPYNMRECSFVQLFPFGDHVAENCSVLRKATTVLDIETDKRHYKLDEQITLKIDFSSDDNNNDAVLKLTYGEAVQNIDLHNSREIVSLTPIEGYKSVSVAFLGDGERSPAEAFPEQIYASDDTFATYIGIATIFLIIYGIGYFARKYIPN